MSRQGQIWGHFEFKGRKFILRWRNGKMYSKVEVGKFDFERAFILQQNLIGCVVS